MTKRLNVVTVYADFLYVLRRNTKEFLYYISQVSLFHIVCANIYAKVSHNVIKLTFYDNIWECAWME